MILPSSTPTGDFNMLPTTLTVTRTDGFVATLPIEWHDHPINIGWWTTAPAPSLSDEHNEFLSDFIGYDVLSTIVYLWLEGNNVTSADVEGCTYTLA